MENICHHNEHLRGWYPTISRDCYDWDIFIQYANSDIQNNPKVFYSLLKKIKRSQKDNPYALIKKNIDWFISATEWHLKSIFQKSYNYRKRNDEAKTLDKEGRAGYILLENNRGKTIKIPVRDFFDFDREKPIGITSHFLNFSVYDDSLKTDEEYILRTFFIDVFRFGCSRELLVLDLKGTSKKVFQNPNDCVWQESRTKIFGGDTENIPCYKCDHKYFEYVLNMLITGKDFLEIEGFEGLLSNLPIEEKYLQIEEFEKNKSRLNWGRYSRIVDTYRWSFPGLLLGAASDSLIYFLAENDRRKLKKCGICGKFFIAEKDLKRKFCYPPRNCGWEAKKKRQREFMKRKRDKAGPDFDPRYL